MIPLGKGAQREIEDHILSRFGCYLVAMNDDPRYADRLNEHARHLFNGKQGIEAYEEEWGEMGDGGKV